jgi:hypothetical protein
VLFGPSAAGGAYIPAFCDVVIMRDGNASMYLGSPRMAEMVIGEKVTLEEMGGAKLHTGVSGVGTQLVKSDEEGIDLAKQWLSYFPSHWEEGPPVAPPAEPGSDDADPRPHPADENKPFDIKKLIDSLVDAESFFEVHPRWAKELVVGFARLDGRAIGIVANQPKQKGGVLFVDSADKAAHFIWLCNAFGLPLLFLADVPGFMIGTAVERQGIIRHGAKMISRSPRRPCRRSASSCARPTAPACTRWPGPAFDPGRVHRAAERVDRGHGPAGGGQRGVLQPAAGDRRPRRAGGEDRGAAARVRRGHRHPAPRVRAGRRRGHPARGPALRAGQALRRRRAQVTRLAGQAQPGPPGLSGSARTRGEDEEGSAGAR